MKIQLLTTCNHAGWLKYGHRMVTSFANWWPKDVKLDLYCENFKPSMPDLVGHVKILDLFKETPQLKTFLEKYDSEKNRGYRDGQRDFRLNAITFAFKVFAQCHAIRNTSADRLIWIDADTRTFDKPKIKALEDMIKNNELCAYIGRKPGTGKARLPFSETGFIQYNLKCPAIQKFAEEFERSYVSGDIFDYEYQVDCFTFDVARRKIEKQENVQSYDLNVDFGKKHPFVNTVLGSFMDHLKGDERKNMGRSKLSDFKERIAEQRLDQDYWSMKGKYTKKVQLRTKK